MLRAKTEEGRGGKGEKGNDNKVVQASIIN